MPSVRESKRTVCPNSCIPGSCASCPGRPRPNANRVETTHAGPQTRDTVFYQQKDTRRPVVPPGRDWGARQRPGNGPMCCSYRCASTQGPPLAIPIRKYLVVHTHISFCPVSIVRRAGVAPRCLAGDALKELLYFLGHIAPRPLHMGIMSLREAPAGPYSLLPAAQQPSNRRTHQERAQRATCRGGREEGPAHLISPVMRLPDFHTDDKPRHEQMWAPRGGVNVPLLLTVASKRAIIH